jgi:hypothetical protein
MYRENRQSSFRDLAELLDSRFKIPGTKIRFGLDPILGLLPGAGDLFTGIISFYFLILAAMQGGRIYVLARMFMNIMMDILIGSIPVLGEFFDVYWKANLRNARILDELQQNPDKTIGESRFWIWFVVILFLALLTAIILLIGWLIAELVGLLL